MSPFSVTVQNVRIGNSAHFLTQLSEAGFDNPIIKLVGADGASAKATCPARGRAADLPEDWRLVQEREGESYRWPKGRDRYAPYERGLVRPTTAFLANGSTRTQDGRSLDLCRKTCAANGAPAFVSDR